MNDSLTAVRPILDAVCDTLVPQDDTVWRAALGDRVATMIGRLPNASDRTRLGWLLQAIDTPGVCFALTGTPVPFRRLDRPGRERALRRLLHHRLRLLRGGGQSLKRLAGVASYGESDGPNPTWPRIGYPGPILAGEIPRAITPLTIQCDTILDCDVVVIGSGAGGGTAAGVLAAGCDVVVLEQGGYETAFDGAEIPSYQRMYLDGALRQTADNGMLVIAGATLGGGTVVNYTTSFRTPDSVRAEWARLSGLPFFTSAAFDAALDAVSVRLGVNEYSGRAGPRDSILERGLRRLGWHVAAMPRNVEGCGQDAACGYCGFGCPRGAKQSMSVTYLADAFRDGARIVTGCHADRLTVEQGRATGVSATVGGHRLTVRARAVVVAAGAIGTPALLLRSGIDWQVGVGLRVHPVTAVWGRFPDEQVDPWSGTIQARYSDEFADLDGGYGYRFETAAVHPGLFAMATPWERPDQYDRVLRELPHTSLVAILLRDRDGGQVTIDSSGVPRVNYAISAYDQRHVRHGVHKAAEVLLAAGARTIWSTQTRWTSLTPGRGGTLGDWLRRVDATGYAMNETVYVSFHLMGSCRMGARAAESVANSEGEVHALPGCFIADGSLFPSASGVNPMVSIAALGHHVGRAVAARLGKA